MHRTWLLSSCACALLLCLFFSTSLSLAASSNWQLIEDDDGIKVWSLAIPGRDLPGFRGITRIDAPIDHVMRYILDVSKHTDWMYNCDESRLIKRLSATRHILYNRINAPWPVKDRDVVVDVDHRYTPQRTAVTFRFRTTKEGHVPVPRRVVRIPRLEGFYRFWQESPTRTNALYQVEVDIGGNVPDRAARRYARSLPFETLRALRNNVEAQKSKTRAPPPFSEP
jgi:hypothetical protein